MLASGDYVRGQRLGLPGDGPGSLAGAGRRVAALAVDWAACALLVRAFVPHLEYGTAASGMTTLGVFWAQVSLFTWLVGASFGQRLAGLGVVRLDRRSLGPGTAVLRTALICLVVPPLVWDRDGRGLHDRWLGTAVLRR